VTGQLGGPTRPTLTSKSVDHPRVDRCPVCALASMRAQTEVVTSSPEIEPHASGEIGPCDEDSGSVVLATGPGPPPCDGLEPSTQSDSRGTSLRERSERTGKGRLKKGDRHPSPTLARFLTSRWLPAIKPTVRRQASRSRRSRRSRSFGTPACTDGYDDLVTQATDVDLDSLTVKVASLDDLIRINGRAAGPRIASSSRSSARFATS
jgi:hypothetical protein